MNFANHYHIYPAPCINREGFNLGSFNYSCQDIGLQYGYNGNVNIRIVDQDYKEHEYLAKRIYVDKDTGDIYISNR